MSDPAPIDRRNFLTLGGLGLAAALPSFTDLEMAEVRRFWDDLGVKPA